MKTSSLYINPARHNGAECHKLSGVEIMGQSLHNQWIETVDYVTAHRYRYAPTRARLRMSAIVRGGTDA